MIGTRGAATSVLSTPTVVSSVDTAPKDWDEGVGQGASLVPTSLYLDQLTRRLRR